MRHVFALVFAALVIPSFAHAQTFDGKYEGKMILTKGGDDCGAKSDEFALEVKGKAIRIVSKRAEKPLAGEINDSGQFFASGTAQNKAALEFRGQILASTKTGLGSVLIKSGDICQFLTSFKRS
jgi:hypothetical protein